MNEEEYDSVPQLIMLLRTLVLSVFKASSGSNGKQGPSGLSVLPLSHRSTVRNCICFESH